MRVRTCVCAHVCACVCGIDAAACHVALRVVVHVPCVLMVGPGGLPVAAGAVIPMKTLDDQKSLAPATLILAVPWAVNVTGQGSVYEDDGASLLYQSGQFSLLQAIFSSAGNASAALTVTPGTGAYEGAPASRAYAVRVRNAPATAHNVTCTLGCPDRCAWGSLCVGLGVG